MVGFEPTTSSQQQPSKSCQSLCCSHKQNTDDEDLGQSLDLYPAEYVSMGVYWRLLCICDKFVWFGLMFNVPVNSYGNVRMVSSPNSTFFLGKLDSAVNQYFMHIIQLVADNNPSLNQQKGGEWP